MRHHQMLGMEHPPARVAWTDRIGLPAVNIVAEQNMAERFHVNADLVRAPGVYEAPHERREMAKLLDHLPVSVRIASARPVFHDGHFVTVIRVAANGLFNAAAQQFGRTGDERHVFFCSERSENCSESPR